MPYVLIAYGPGMDPLTGKLQKVAGDNERAPPAQATAPHLDMHASLTLGQGLGPLSVMHSASIPATSIPL
jgi:hypothetical protein